MRLTIKFLAVLCAFHMVGISAHAQKTTLSPSEFAKQADKFIKDSEKWGYIAIKKPDFWGQARFAGHRVDFEDTMKAEMSKFSVRLQGANSASDSALAAMAMSFQGALPGPQATVIQPYEMLRRFQELKRQDVVDQPGVSTEITTPGEDGEETVTTIPEPKVFPTQLPKRDVIGIPEGPAAKDLISDFDIITRNDTLKYEPKGFGGDTGLGLEPTLVLNQHARYLNHLNELRRINEGDDNVDAPGYSLYLMRVPVSITPSLKTSRGYGAQVTMSVEPELGDRFLEDTFRNLVINDVIEQLSTTIWEAMKNDNLMKKYRSLPNPDVKDAEKKKEFERVKSSADFESYSPQTQMLFKFASDADESKNNESRAKALEEAREEEVAKLKDEVKLAINKVFGIESVYRSAPLAFPTTNNALVYGELNIAYIASEFLSLVGKTDGLQLPDLQYMLRARLEAAYDYLNSDTCVTESGKNIWQSISSDCIECDALALLSQDVMTRDEWLTSIGNEKLKTLESETKEYPAIVWRRRAFMEELGSGDKYVPSIEMNMAWAIMVQSSFLSSRLKEDMADLADRDREFRSILRGNAYEQFRFFEPYELMLSGKHGLAPAKLFNEYVKHKWPTYVFALDPMTEDQNIMDQFSQRREIQFAMAMSLASGWFKSQSLRRYARRLERDMETVAINRTVVGFGYGEDTFGWRFFPRFQTPGLEHNASALVRQTLIGPKSDELLRKAHALEEGPRECVALVVMPSFVGNAFVDVRSEWFPLGKRKFPQNILKRDFLRTKGPKLTDALKLSRSLRALQEGRAIDNGGEYRWQDVEWLNRHVGDLADRMPIQSIAFNLPYDRSVSGMELFDWSAGALAPELQGWYGMEKMDIAKGATFFVVGRHFNTLHTQAVVNGYEAQSQLMSREVLKITVPAGMKLNKGQSEVEVRIATPYGVSGAVMVPTFSSAKPTPSPSKSGLAMAGTSPKVTLKDKPAGGITAAFDATSINDIRLTRSKTGPNTPNNGTVAFKVVAKDKDGKSHDYGVTSTTMNVRFSPPSKDVRLQGGSFVGLIKPVIESRFDKRTSIVSIECTGIVNFDDVGASHEGLPVLNTDKAITISVIDQVTR